MCRQLVWSASVVVLCGTFAGAAEEPALQIWAVDPLVKVFPDSPAAPGEATADVARGEHASLQAVVRCPALLRGVKAEVADLAMEGGTGALKPRTARFVGYVSVDAAIPRPPADRLRIAPAFFPDPLLDAAEVMVSPGAAQPIWVTVPVPLDAAAGTYKGSIRVSGTANDKALSASLPLTVRVWPAKVDKCRLWVTNWFQVSRYPGWRQDGRMTGKADLPQDSDAYWQWLRRYARNMADHRQNVALIPPLSLADFKPRPDGGLDIDFARFNRWVQIFIDEGVVGRIEGGHIGGRVAGWESAFCVGIRRVRDSKVESASVSPASPEADAFYARFFPALVENLKEKGWLDRYVQHLADEPIDTNTDTYRPMAALLRKHAPALRVIEACHTKNLTGSIQVWVPQLNFLHQDFAHYQERQKAGDEVWFYTCLGPQEEYANRFIEQPLIKTRLLHWINFRYGVTGYLHWGYNYWGDHDPYRELAIPWDGGAQYLPAGDAWIVYPGKDGVLDSIRFEAMRDGIVDHELLSRLAERDAGAARRLAESFVRDFDKYDTDVTRFRAARRELLERLSGKSGS